MHTLFFFFFFFLQIGFAYPFSIPAVVSDVRNRTRPVSCPFDFDVLRRLGQKSKQASPGYDIQCRRARYIATQGLRLVQAEYLRRTGCFLPPSAAADTCSESYNALIDEFVPNFNIRNTCDFRCDLIEQVCTSITTRADFERNVSRSALLDVVTACNRSLVNTTNCAICTTSLSRISASYLTDADCSSYPSLYAAAFANRFGPTDTGTAKCLFSLDFTSRKYSVKKKNKTTVLIVVVVVVLAFILFVIFAGIWFIRRRRNTLTDRNNTGSSVINRGTALTRFTLGEIKIATQNFSTSNIIGRGGFGNVYKGILLDESQVALKRFKNCAAASDKTFTHEVKVIASVHHVNLLNLRGYCTATTELEGRQRIIVCDLVKNGSLYDNLFDMTAKKLLSWSIRLNIALGTARGIAYLLYGVQPSIIHRDIKASNILLDENFEPKVADFGLAKFAPEGMTHLSTRVAGTMGYVAPEYALYGQLTERSDVYSFGVLFLELLSGKKALLELENCEKQVLLADWAWDLVRKGRTLEVIDKEMPGLGRPESMEKFVMLAVLCSHPQMYARPTMDQVVRILETDGSVPSIPDRPISIIPDSDNSSFSGSGHILYSGP